LESFESWTKALDEGYRLDIFYLDYRTAFDTVPQQKMLLKLRGFGMPEEILNWIAAFLSGRKMRVGVNGAFSSWTEILSAWSPTGVSTAWDHALLSCLSTIYLIGSRTACECLQMTPKSGVP